jgi:hypothetical protein
MNRLHFPVDIAATREEVRQVLWPVYGTAICTSIQPELPAAFSDLTR